LNTYSLISY